MRRSIRWLSMSPTFKAHTSLTRSPAPYATDRAVRCLRVRALSIKRLASSRLKTTGRVRATRTWLILLIRSGALERHLEEELQSRDRRVESGRRDATIHAVQLVTA